MNCEHKNRFVKNDYKDPNMMGSFCRDCGKFFKFLSREEKTRIRVLNNVIKSDDFMFKDDNGNEAIYLHFSDRSAKEIVPKAGNEILDKVRKFIALYKKNDGNYMFMQPKDVAFLAEILEEQI